MTTTEIENFFVGPYQRYLMDPKNLSDADLAQLGGIDRDLETRAAARRAGYAKPVEAWEKRSLSRGEFLEFVEDHFAVHVSAVIERLKHAEQRLVELERVAARKSVSGVHWMGVYEPGKMYAEGSLTTVGGSLWLAEVRDPVGKPGEGVSGWRLIVKGDHGHR